MNGRAWLLFATAFILSADYCNSAFPRSNGGDPGGGVIVQLFRWRYEDIARECEQFLAPKGYGAVEVAPVTEHWVVSGKPAKWDEPYYPVSYNIKSRSGDEKSFKEMVERCNKAGIKVYVSVVMAYMANYPDLLQGYGGSTANGNRYDYPAVPYDDSQFLKKRCLVRDYNTTQLRTCDMQNDHHLNHAKPDVRQTLRDFLNKLISFGVAGFSVDAANRIDPDHLRAIFTRIRYLNTSHGFACESEPYIYHDYDTVKSFNDDTAKEYCALGRVADYKYRNDLNLVAYGYKFMSSFGKTLTADIGTGYLPNDKALVFIDSQIAVKKRTTFRTSYNTRKELICTTALMLANPFGQPRIASNYNYNLLEDAPPIEQNLIAPVVLQGEKCTGRWVCEHRWPEIYNMIEFRSVVGDENVTNVWDNGQDVLAFSRGNKGFILMQGFYFTLREFSATVKTGLPKGEYCDVISGSLQDNKCTGKTISVNEDGSAKFAITYYDLGVIAIHVQAKLQ